MQHHISGTYKYTWIRTDYSGKSTNTEMKMKTKENHRRISNHLSITCKCLQACGLIMFTWSKKYKPKINTVLLMWATFLQIYVFCSTFIFMNELYRTVVGVQGIVLFVCSSASQILAFFTPFTFMIKWRDNGVLIMQEYKLTSHIDSTMCKLNRRSQIIWLIFILPTLACFISGLNVYTYSTLRLVFEMFNDLIVYLRWILPTVLFQQCSQSIANYVKYENLNTYKMNNQTFDNKIKTANLLQLGIRLIQVNTND